MEKTGIAPKKTPKRFIVSNIFTYFARTKDKGCSQKGLRLYPKNLIRVMPSQGTFLIRNPSHERSPPAVFYTLIHIDGMITVEVNEKRMEVTPDCSLTELLKVLEQSERGTAIAVNERIISRPLWENTTLKEGDKVIIIKAAFGG